MKKYWQAYKSFHLRLAKRIGRRGSYLLFLALLDALYGWSLWIDTGPVFQQVDLLLAAKTWALIWWFVGALCLLQAFAKLDRAAFSMAVSLKVVWALIMTYAWLFTPTNPRGWLASIIWFGFAGVTAIVSFWPEHTKIDYTRSDYGAPNGGT